MSGAVNQWYSPPVCSMINEIGQFLKLFMFFPGAMIMMSVS